MFNLYLLFKKLKKQFLSINDSIESYFDKFRSFVISIKKNKIEKNNKVILTAGTLIILTLGYFLLPTIYDRNILKSQIQNQLLKKFGIEVQFKEKINYGLLPKPHFNSKNLIITQNQKEIAKVKNFKVFIDFDKFFSINKIKVRNIVFKKADFNINKDDILFFRNLLYLDKIEDKIIFKDSNIFFLNKNKSEMLFINKIKKKVFFYDENKSEVVMSSKNEVFNVPYKIIFKNNIKDKNFITKFNSQKIRLNIENNLSYNNENKVGILDMRFINKNTSVDYKIKKNFIEFSSVDKKNNYKGQIDFKPFYLNASLNYNQLNSKNFINQNSVLFEIIKSQVLNNKNLNLDIDLNINKLTNINHLNNLTLKIGIQEGDIILSNSNLMWKNDLKISLKESFLNYYDDEVKLIGKINFDYSDINNFYKSFQINKKNRKDIEQIEIDFIYRLMSKKISFDNVKVNNVSNVNLEKFISKFNLSDTNLNNKIVLKNFINNFFNAYDG